MSQSVNPESNKDKVHILCVLAEGFEEIEAITVIDLLRRAGINIIVSGLNQLTVRGSHQVNVVCDVLLHDVDEKQYTHLFLPGGQPGSQNLRSSKSLQEMIRRFDRAKKGLLAICAAPIVFHEAGILSNRKVTSFPLEKEVFKQSVYLEEDVVHDRNLITSRGVGTAIPFALYLVQIFCGKEKSEELQRRILYQCERR